MNHVFSASIVDGVVDEVGHPPPYTDEELSSVDSLLIWSFDGWTGLDRLPSLEAVRVGELPSNDSLPGLPGHLKTVGIFDSAVSSVARLGDFPHLRRVSLENTNVRDIAPLLRCPKLKHLKVVGCPLRSDAQAIVEELALRGGKVSVPLGDEWKATLALRAAGLEANYHEGCIKFPGAGYRSDIAGRKFPVTMAEVDEMLAISNLSYSLVKERFGRAPRAMASWVPPRERMKGPSGREYGTADEAQRWVHSAGLKPADVDGLLRFIDRFPNERFSRVTEEGLRQLGRPLAPYLAQCRMALSGLAGDGDGPELWTDEPDVPWWPRLQWDDGEEKKLAAKNHPFAHSHHWTLVYDADADLILGGFTDASYEARFTGWGGVVFDGYGDFFDHVVKVKYPREHPVEARR